MDSRILVVEDTPELRRALQRYLERLGHRVEAVESLAAARARIDEGGIEVLISDIDLPDGSGLTLAEEFAPLPSIVVTGLHDMALAAEAMRIGAVDFLTKPIDLDHLAEVLEDALRRGRATEVEPEVPPSEEVRPRIVGRHPAIVELFKGMGVASASDSPVLIRGESGSGKELVAREVHRLSGRKGPFVAVNCASVPDSLAESELFGHARGAFTGAVDARRGVFEASRGGTLFLDEIGDASPSFQATILRAIEEEEFSPLGSERTHRFDARVISATHRPLEERIAEGTFRADLFYRLDVLEMVIPALRDRPSDIPELATYLLARMARRLGRGAPEIGPDGIAKLAAHSWPGNVRELENVLERALLSSRGTTLLAGDVRIPSSGVEVPPQTGGGSQDDAMAEVVRRHAASVLERCGGNKREAARRLGISPGKLYRILEEG